MPADSQPKASCDDVREQPNSRSIRNPTLRAVDMPMDLAACSLNSGRGGEKAMSLSRNTVCTQDGRLPGQPPTRPHHDRDGCGSHLVPESGDISRCRRMLEDMVLKKFARSTTECHGDFATSQTNVRSSTWLGKINRPCQSVELSNSISDRNTSPGTSSEVAVSHIKDNWARFGAD